MPMVGSKTDGGGGAPRSRRRAAVAGAAPRVGCCGASAGRRSRSARSRCCCWRRGFGWFLWSLPADEIVLARDADGIVVLTGGASRISDAIELLAAGRGKRLLISGANRATTSGEISRLNPEFGRIVSCCVDFDRSLNTLGNAIETRRWAREPRFPLADRGHVELSHAARHGRDRPSAPRRRAAAVPGGHRQAACRALVDARRHHEADALGISEICGRPHAHPARSGRRGAHGRSRAAAGSPERRSASPKPRGSSSSRPMVSEFPAETDGARMISRSPAAADRRSWRRTRGRCSRSRRARDHPLRPVQRPVLSEHARAHVRGAADAGDAAPAPSWRSCSSGRAATIWLLRTVCGITVELRGLEKIPPGPLLVASKHQSLWETFALVPLFADPAFILKRELMWLPFFGWYAWKAEMIPVDRGARSQALAAISARARIELARDRQIVIFPEGTRRPPGAEPTTNTASCISMPRAGLRACRSRSIPACSGRAARSAAIPARSWPSFSTRSRPGSTSRCSSSACSRRSRPPPRG